MSSIVLNFKTCFVAFHVIYLEEISLPLEENVHLAIVMWSVYISIQYNWFIVLFMSSVPVSISLCFCLAVVSIIESRILKSPDFIVEPPLALLQA